MDKQEFITKFKRRPGWRLALNLQHILGYEGNESSEVWKFYKDLLKDDNVFGFIHIESLFFYLILSKTSSLENAKEWFKKYEDGGQVFTPI